MDSPASSIKSSLSALELLMETNAALEVALTKAVNNNTYNEKKSQGVIKNKQTFFNQKNPKYDFYECSNSSISTEPYEVPCERTIRIPSFPQVFQNSDITQSFSLYHDHNRKVEKYIECSILPNRKKKVLAPSKSLNHIPTFVREVPKDICINRQLHALYETKHLLSTATRGVVIDRKRNRRIRCDPIARWKQYDECWKSDKFLSSSERKFDPEGYNAYLEHFFNRTM